MASLGAHEATNDHVKPQDVASSLHVIDGEDTASKLNSPAIEETHNIPAFERGEGATTIESPSSHYSDPIAGLDVDSQEDVDSAIGGFTATSSTTSLRASVYDFVLENGRRYHRFKEGDYLLPNDEAEQERLELQHYLMSLTLDGKLHLAPIEDMEGGLHNALDIGTGTGIWAIDFANVFPSVNVIGTDLSPIQPNFVPANCRFEIDDAEEDWAYDHALDYIHGRALATCFKSHKTVFENAFKALRPGGYLELQDFGLPILFLDSSGHGTALELWIQRFMAGGLALGMDFLKSTCYKQILEEVGFVDVAEKRYQWPIGTWAKGERMKTLGTFVREDFLAGLHGASMAIMTRGLAMSAEEVEKFLVDVRKDIQSNRIHAFVSLYIVYGRKPEKSAPSA